MTPYTLEIRAYLTLYGREAEAACRAIGVERVDNQLSFDFFAWCEVPDDRVDDVVARDATQRVLRLDREGVLALRPGDYVATVGLDGGTKIRAAAPAKLVPDAADARLLAIFDAVAGPAAARAKERPGAAGRAAALFDLYAKTFEGGEPALAYQALADLVEHFKPRGGDVRALLEEAIADVETGVFSDGATA